MKTVYFAFPVLSLCLAGWWWSRNDKAPVRSETHAKSANGNSVFFREVSETGLSTQIPAQTSPRYFFPEIMGGGAAFLDFDRDGDLDVLLVNGEIVDAPSSRFPQTLPRLFEQTADGSFKESPEFRFAPTGYGQGVAVGDVNNDGWQDVFVSQYGPDQLYINQKDGTFVEVAAEAGLINPHWGTSACFVDVDRDGYLDLYVANYVDYNPSQPCIDESGSQDFCNPLRFSGVADRLFLNTTNESDGRVTFRDLSLEAGIAQAPSTGLGVVSFDANGDHWPDIYVANDGHANHLWINQRDGTFTEQAILYGAAYDPLGRSQAGMGIGIGDINRDGTLDLAVTHLDGESHALYTFDPGQSAAKDASRDWGLWSASLEQTGFGCVLADWDHDGLLDLAVVNGRVMKSPKSTGNANGFWRPYAELNQLFFHDVTSFEPAVSAKDGFLNSRGVSRALVTGDIDRDGDLDLLVTNLDQPPQLFRNEIPKRGHWVQVLVTDPRHGNRLAYGAEIKLASADNSWQGVFNPASSYLTSHEPVLHFGVGETDELSSVTVVWPDGITEKFSNQPVDCVLELKRGDGDMSNTADDLP